MRVSTSHGSDKVFLKGEVSGCDELYGLIAFRKKHRFIGETSSAQVPSLSVYKASDSQTAAFRDREVSSPVGSANALPRLLAQVLAFA